MTSHDWAEMKSGRIGASSKALCKTLTGCCKRRGSAFGECGLLWMNQEVGLLEEQVMAVVGGDDHERLVPVAVFLDPVGDVLDRLVAAVHGADRVVEVVVVIGPVDIA